MRKARRSASVDIKQVPFPVIPRHIKKSKEGEFTVTKYKCKICGYIYDPEKGDPGRGVNPGTPFEALPDTWVCPFCGASKDKFRRID